MNELSPKAKRNIRIFYISEMSRAAIFFQTVVWFSYESGFLSGEKIAFYGALIIIFDVIFQVPTGAFADIFGKKRALILGNISIVIGALILGFIPTELSMFLFTLLYGLGNAFLGGTYSSLIYNMLIAEKNVDLYPKIKANGALMFQILGGFFLVIGGYVYGIASVLPYLLFAGGVLIAAISCLFLTEYEKGINNFDVRKFTTKNIEGFKAIFKNSYISTLSIASILMMAIAFCSQRFLVQPFMSEMGMDEVTKGWASMLAKVLVALLGFGLMRRKKIVSNKYFVLVIPFVMILSMVPAKYFNMPASLIFIFGIAFSSANADLFMSPIINANIDSSIRTTALSAINMLTSMVTAAIQLLSASYLVSSQLGSFYQLLGIATAVIIIPLMVSIVKFKKIGPPDLSLVGDEAN